MAILYRAIIGIPKRGHALILLATDVQGGNTNATKLEHIDALVVDTASLEPSSVLAGKWDEDSVVVLDIR